MPFPIKTCAVCGQEFELKPDKPGFAILCPHSVWLTRRPVRRGSPGIAADREVQAARREAMRNLLYRKDS